MEALEMTLLFDYYGELLSERQRTCLDMRYNQDMSLGEIAEELGVSRQGVHDNLSRAEDFLEKTEAVLGCVRRDMVIRTVKKDLCRVAMRLESNPDPAVSDLSAQIRSIVSRLEE